MRQKNKLSFAIREEEKGFSAQCIEFPGIITQADTKEALMERINDVVDGYFKAFPEEKSLVSEAKPCKYESKIIMEFEKKRNKGKLEFVPLSELAE